MNTGGNGDGAGFTCLVLHDVLPHTTAAGGGPERFAMPLAAFERLLDLIRDQGLAGCSLETARRSTGPRVAITFDDAAAGQALHAAPALHARGMSATIYVVTDWVGRPGFATWDQLRAARDLGMSIQSHTRRHPFLSECDPARLRDEFQASREALDRELAQETEELALPGGDAPRRRHRGLIAEAGYRVVACSRWGWNPDAWSGNGPRWVRRCWMRGDPSDAWARRVVTGDRWLAAARYPRDTALAALRSTLGPTRYSRWRRRLLDALAGGPA